MAKLYGEILSSALMTFDKSFARANGQPLDSTEVYYSLAAAQEYAAGAGAYVGQKIVVVENGIVTHYGIENEAGDLKELGSKPVGDNKSIVVAEDGTVSLKGVGTLVFERELEDGTKEAVQYQPLMTSAGLVWVEPSKTTVEGLATLIDGLSVRVKALEDDHVGADDIKDFATHDDVTEAVKDFVTNGALAEAIKDFATDAEVEAAVKAEADRALAAEKALGERIDAIDFIDGDELDAAITAARELISKEIDDDVKVAKDRADEAYTLAEGKVDADDYAADKVLDKADRDEIRGIANEALNTINAFLEEESLDDTVNTLKEIQEELKELGNAVQLEEQFAAKADKTVVDGIDTRVKAIENAPYVTKAQLDDVDGKFASYTNTEDLTTLLADKQDVIPAETYDVYGAAAAAEEAAKGHAESVAATAKSEAIEAAASAAAGIYATKTSVSDLETALDGRLDALEAINHGLYATKEELNAHNTAAEGKYATKEALAPVKQTADNAAAKVETLEDKIEEITSVGGEPNVIDYVKVNGTILEVEKDAEGKSTKTVNVIVPTKASDLTDDTGFDARITAAQTQADKGVSDAAAAHAAANQAQSEVDALEIEVGGIQTAVAGHTTSIADHTTRITALEQADIAHATEYSTLSGIVSGHTTTIAGLATKTELAATDAKVGANESAIKTLNDVTIPGINEEISRKANASVLNDYYKKTEVDAIVGDVAEGKTLVEMIGEAQAAATYDDTAVKKLISDEEARAKAAEEALGGRIDGIDALLNTVDKEDTITSLKELAIWVEAHGGEAAEMAAAIEANTTAIAAINNAENGVLVQAKAYTDAEIAKIHTVDGDSIKLNESNKAYIAKVSTDVLEMGSLTLILNGGTAADI